MKSKTCKNKSTILQVEQSTAFSMLLCTCNKKILSFLWLSKLEPINWTKWSCSDLLLSPLGLTSFQNPTNRPWNDSKVRTLWKFHSQREGLYLERKIICSILKKIWCMTTLRHSSIKGPHRLNWVSIKNNLPQSKLEQQFHFIYKTKILTLSQSSSKFL